MDRSNRQATTPRSTFAALRSRNYRLYWLGLVCYVLGHRAEYVTFAWEVSRDRIYSLCWNLLPLGGMIGGALAAAVGARFAVAFGGAMVALNALLLLGSRRLRALA